MRAAFLPLLLLGCAGHTAPDEDALPFGDAPAAKPPQRAATPPEATRPDRQPGTPAPGPRADNRPPELGSFDPVQLRPGDTLDIRADAHDPDGDVLEFTLEGDRPQGVELDPRSGRLRWTATAADAGRALHMAIGVTDGDLWAIEPLPVTVVDPNVADAPPEIVRGGHALARVGRLLLLRPEVRDEHPDRLRFSPAGEWPEAAELDALDGSLRWTPGRAHAGAELMLRFAVTDGVHTILGAFTVEVEAEAPPPAGAPPEDAPPADAPPEDAPPEDAPPEEPPPAEPPEEQPAEPPEEQPADPPSAEPGADRFGHAPGPALEIDWARAVGGVHTLVARPDGDVHAVTWYVDGDFVGESEQAPGFEVSAALPPGEGLLVEAVGLDEDGFVLTMGRGAIDVTETHTVFIRQVGDQTYEIGLRHAPPEVRAIEVRADGVPLVDGESGRRRSDRLAVRSFFFDLGPRRFELDTFGLDGGHRGTLRRALVLR